MCNPVAFVAAGEALNFIQQTRNANAINEQQDRAFKRNVELIGAQRDLRERAIRIDQEQRARLARQEVESISEQGTLALGIARLGAGESGVSGGSFGGLLSDIRRQEAQEALTVIQNLEFSDAATERDIKASKLSTQSAIESAVPTPIAKPNILQSLINIGGAIALGDSDLSKSKIEAGDTSKTPFGSSLYST